MQMLSCFHFEIQYLSHFWILKNVINTAGVSSQVSKEIGYKNLRNPENSQVFL